MTDARAACEEWNASHEPGCCVWLVDRDGRERPARTESDAFRIANRACVMIEGKGIFALHAVSPRIGRRDKIEAVYRGLAEINQGGW